MTGDRNFFILSSIAALPDLRLYVHLAYQSCPQYQLLFYTPPDIKE